MPAKTTDMMALFHYVDGDGFGGDIEVHASDVDTLFAKIDDVREKAKNRKFTGRPADKDRAPSTFVRVEPKTTRKAEGTPAKTMEDAAAETFGGKECPVDGFAMVYKSPTPNPDGSPALARTGRFAGKPLPDFYECPNCQKRIWNRSN